jgi:hypothetical protein
MRRWPLSLALVASAAGCAHDAPLAPIEMPVALHTLAGAGMNPAQHSTAYLVVYTQEARYRPLVPQLTEIIASELRTAAPVEVVLVQDRGCDSDPGGDWSDVCRGFGLPTHPAAPHEAVVFCELQELDAYPPLRLGLSLRIHRLMDGELLTGTQGVWDGRQDVVVPVAGFRWPWKKMPPPPPPVEANWSQYVEAGSMVDLMRRAARDSIQSIWASGSAMGCPPVAGQGAPNAGSNEFFVPPTLPPADLQGGAEQNALPSLEVPSLGISESTGSVPEAPRP